MIILKNAGKNKGNAVPEKRSKTPIFPTRKGSNDLEEMRYGF